MGKIERVRFTVYKVETEDSKHPGTYKSYYWHAYLIAGTPYNTQYGNKPAEMIFNQPDWARLKAKRICWGEPFRYDVYRHFYESVAFMNKKDALECASRLEQESWVISRVPKCRVIKIVHDESKEVISL